VLLEVAMLVMKFGGTSVGSAEAMKQAAAVVVKMKNRYDRVVVVTSAMAGVTNKLIESAKAAESGDPSVYQEAQKDLLALHMSVVESLIQDEYEQATLHQWFRDRLDEFGRLCHSIEILGELTPRGLDVVSGLGERMSAPLLAAVLRSVGVDAKQVEATRLIVTDGTFGSAVPLMEETCEKCSQVLLPMLDRGTIPVVTGFIGATRDGIPTTLGRGGSDYSAAVIGACLDASEIQIWTDVNGVMTANPNVVPEARTLPQLSFTEAAELAYFGAKVLHPKTMLPAVEKEIPVRVLNTFDPDGPNTLISRNGAVEGSVKAITAIKGMSLINVEGKGMIGVPGIAARTFGTVAKHGISVLMISQASSEQSICFVIPSESGKLAVQALEEEFSRELSRRQIDKVEIMEDVVVVAVVGAGMRGTPGIAARLFGALGEHGLNVIAIAQGSSEANISIVVVRDDADETVRQLHRAFGLAEIG